MPLEGVSLVPAGAEGEETRAGFQGRSSQGERQQRRSRFKDPAWAGEGWELVPAPPAVPSELCSSPRSCGCLWPPDSQADNAAQGAGWPRGGRPAGRRWVLG